MPGRSPVNQSAPPAKGSTSMQFENSFDVPLPPAEAWKVLMDVPRIAPCFPGAELTETLGPDKFKGRAGVKIGPVNLFFAGEHCSYDFQGYMNGAAQSGADTARAIMAKVSSARVARPYPRRALLTGSLGRDRWV